MPTGFIETEHLLLGLMREDALLRTKLINPHGSAEGLRRELAECIEISGQTISTSQDLPLSTEAQRVLSRAAEEAEHLGHGSIDSGHLMLGVFRMNGRAAAALDHQGISYDGYREALAAREEPTVEEPNLEEPALAVAANLQTEPNPPLFRAVMAPSLREPVSRLSQLVEQPYIHLATTAENFGDHVLKRKPLTRKQALGHLIDWAATHHDWFGRALDQPNVAVAGYPEDSWLPAQRYADVPWMQLLEFWTSFNRLMVHNLSLIPEEKLNTSCRVGIEAPRTLEELIVSYVDHCEDVVGQILAHG